MAEKFRHHEDCSIERREDFAMGDVADLYDCDGDKVWTFPGDMTDSQIMLALSFANHAYGKGVEVGEHKKTHAIKAVLGLA